MTQEDKELLLKDLCARLPYGVICKIHYSFNNETTFGEDVETEEDCSVVRIDAQTQTAYFDWIYDWFNIEDIKPYLRPMSSMTKEEREEYQKFLFPCSDYDGRVVVGVYHRDLYKVYDWLNAHHFDYRNLIEKGLAIEAPEGMYIKKGG